MQNVTAVICETNPYHNGHASLFHRARAETGGLLVAIMSGNFVQRGQAASFDKYTRARVLAEAGVDLVVELPFPWSCAGGEDFARAGVYLASRMGASALAFGSESGDGAALSRMAAFCASDAYKNAMRVWEREHPGKGAAAMHYALSAESGLPLAANDKLAVWYLQNLAEYPEIRPLVFPRIPEGETITSATRLRGMLSAGAPEEWERMAASFIPEKALLAYREAACRFVWDNPASRLSTLMWLFFRTQGEALRRDPAGIRGRLHHAAQDSADGEAFWQQAASRKYTNARLRRTALYAMLGVEDADIAAYPAYTLVLAANRAGCAYLRTRKQTGFPIGTKPSQTAWLPADAARQYALACRADRLYTLCMPKPPESGWFLRQTPFLQQ